MHEPQTPSTSPRRTGIRPWMVVAVLVPVAIVGVGTALRAGNRHDVAEWTSAQAVPTVTVITPNSGDAGDMVLPARLEAWQQAPVYARTTGYVTRWHADIGTRVKAGQLLAELDTPEVDEQLVAAGAAQRTAEAEREIARTTSERWSQLVTSGVVSRQDVEERRATYASRTAQASEAAAESSRVRTLTGFKRIVAPFDGVVTTRATDVGALVASGNAASTPLFTVADLSKLRMYVSVPQAYLSRMDLAKGGGATFTTPDAPGQTFEAQSLVSAGAVDRASGTVLMQLAVENPDGRLTPGAYAQATLKLDSSAGEVRVPVSAVLFRREGTALALLDKGDVVRIQPIVIGRDYGNEVQVSTGLGAGDTVVDNPPEALATGDRVKRAAPKAAVVAAK